MLRSIGTGPKDDDRSLQGRLLDCHARIREMLALAAALGTSSRASDEEIAESAARLRRYFKRALPMHERDEEDSLLPRLEPFDATGALARMRGEHGEHGALVATLVETAGHLADAPQTWSELHEELARNAEALAASMLPHLDHEEETIFPLLLKLDEATVTRIVDEMQARRAADGGGGGGRRQRG